MERHLIFPDRTCLKITHGRNLHVTCPYISVKILVNFDFLPFS